MAQDGIHPATVSSGVPRTRRQTLRLGQLAPSRYGRRSYVRLAECAQRSDDPRAI